MAGRVDDAEIHMVGSAGNDRLLSDRANALALGQNSGYQALGLAIASAASRIVLCGYDMHYPGGQSHWHGDHPEKVGESIYKTTFRRYFEKLAPLLKDRVEVLNASPISLLTCFPKVDLASVLPDT